MNKEWDKKSDYNQFKLTCGENFALVFKAGQEVSDEIIKIMEQNSHTVEYQEYTSEVEDYIEEHCARRDKDGNLEMDNEGNLILKDGIPDISHITEKHKETIAMFKVTEELCEAKLDEIIEISLKKIEIAKIPVNISGSYLNSIKSMIQ